jgi:hypothetical protein
MAERTETTLLVLLTVLDNEEEGKRDDGEGGEHAGGDLDGRGDPRDADDLEVARCVVGLAVGHELAGPVQHVGAHEIEARGDVPGDAILEAAAGGPVVGLLGELELARLVLAQVVVGLAPPAVLAALRRVAQLYHDLGGVGRLCTFTPPPFYVDLALAGVQNCPWRDEASPLGTGVKLRQSSK